MTIPRRAEHVPAAAIRGHLARMNQPLRRSRFATGARTSGTLPRPHHSPAPAVLQTGTARTSPTRPRRRTPAAARARRPLSQKLLGETATAFYGLQ